jgi:hypothetical protein
LRNRAIVIAAARLLAMTEPYQYMVVVCAVPLSESFMHKVAAVLLFALTLAACDAVNTLTEGTAHARAVESDLERATGVKPNVGFNWHNGRLTSVTVQYPSIVESKGLNELAKTVRSSVVTQFKQTPDNIVLSFSLGK